jgi:two-component system, cell cycle sensor histidine kinase and response regulator CckA
MTIQSVKILLIEDDQDDAILFEETVSEVDDDLKVDMHTVDNLEDGIEYLSSDLPDIVFLDLSLPGTQGLDTFLTLHNQFPTLQIVILTGFIHDSLADEARKLGALDYLVKGEINGDSLSKVIRLALE